MLCVCFILIHKANKTQPKHVVLFAPPCQDGHTIENSTPLDDVLDFTMMIIDALGSLTINFLSFLVLLWKSKQSLGCSLKKIKHYEYDKVASLDLLFHSMERSCLLRLFQ